MTTVAFSPPGIVPSLTRAWVNFYCIGMRSEARTIRCIEIESDLWEHYADRASSGANPAATGLEAFSRLLRGVPSDIAWRFQAEGLHMNFNFPVERAAGALLLFLLIPFVAGSAISGYDTAQEGWNSEFLRFAGIPAHQRDITAFLHAFIGLLLIGAASQAFVALRERSPRLVTLGSVLLVVAGAIMLVNAAAYRAMSATANDYLATNDPSTAATGRAFAHVVETLAMTNLFATALGIFAIAVALLRLRMVPRWTIALPALGVSAPIVGVAFSSVWSDSGWFVMVLCLVCIALWLVICGVWLLLGGASVKSMKGVPAHSG